MKVVELQDAVYSSQASTLWLLDDEGRYWRIRDPACVTCIKLDLNGFDPQWQIVAVKNNGDLEISADSSVASRFTITEEGVYDSDLVLSGRVVVR